jgi:hypothetical protein
MNVRGLVRPALAERRFHDLRRPVIGAVDQVAVSVERDRRIRVSQPPRDRQDVHAARNQRRGVGVAQAVQGNA